MLMRAGPGHEDIQHEHKVFKEDFITSRFHPAAYFLLMCFKPIWLEDVNTK